MKVVPGLTQEAMEALKNMLKISSSRRYTAGELLKMPYFKF